MKLRIPATLISAFVLAVALTSCLQDGPSTETGNPNLGGALTDAQGKPIPGLVKLYRLPAAAAGGTDTAAAIAPVFVAMDTVKADGKWGFDSLAAAAYAVEGIDAAGQRFGLLRDLVLAAPEDTLVRALAVAPPGRLHGRATRGTNALPAGVIANEKILVRLGGADRWAMTDTAGVYAIANVPAGSYRMAFAASDGHYLTAYLDGIAVSSDVDAAAPQVDLEWSRFIAPPAVRGITIARDSATNTVRLSWRAVRLSGGAAVLYEITRADGGPEPKAVRSPDTAFADALGDLPRGTPLAYTVRAINPLGEKGPADTLPPVLAPGRDTVGPAIGLLEGVVHAKGAPIASAAVHLYSIPSAPGSPDSLPLPAVLRDSGFSDASGRWRFKELPKGRYTVIAQGKPGTGALATGLQPRAAGVKLDSLEPLAIGSVDGFASRDGKWSTQPFKGDENILVSLAGTPFASITQYGSPPIGGAFSLKSVPPGTYQLVVYPMPEGGFLADTQTVIILAGNITRLGAVIKPGYNPNAPPPKLKSLAIASATRARVSLTWQADVNGYPWLKGYRVLRLSADLQALDSSAVIPDLHWDDDISKVAAGTKLKYVVRVVAVNGREGAPGGNISGDPIEHTVAGP